MEYYSMLTKQNETKMSKSTCYQSTKIQGGIVKCISISEKRQSGKATYWMISSIQHPREGKTTEIVEKITGCQGLGIKEGEMNR